MDIMSDKEDVLSEDEDAEDESDYEISDLKFEVLVNDDGVEILENEMKEVNDEVELPPNNSEIDSVGPIFDVDQSQLEHASASFEESSIKNNSDSDNVGKNLKPMVESNILNEGIVLTSDQNEGKVPDNNDDSISKVSDIGSDNVGDENLSDDQDAREELTSNELRIQWNQKPKDRIVNSVVPHRLIGHLKSARLRKKTSVRRGEFSASIFSGKVKAVKCAFLGKPVLFKWEGVFTATKLFLDLANKVERIVGENNFHCGIDPGILASSVSRDYFGIESNLVASDFVKFNRVRTPYNFQSRFKKEASFKIKGFKSITINDKMELTPLSSFSGATYLGMDNTNEHYVFGEGNITNLYTKYQHICYWLISENQSYEFSNLRLLYAAISKQYPNNIVLFHRHQHLETIHFHVYKNGNDNKIKFHEQLELYAYEVNILRDIFTYSFNNANHSSVADDSLQMYARLVDNEIDFHHISPWIRSLFFYVTQNDGYLHPDLSFQKNSVRSVSGRWHFMERLVEFKNNWVANPIHRQLVEEFNRSKSGYVLNRDNKIAEYSWNYSVEQVSLFFGELNVTVDCLSLYKNENGELMMGEVGVNESQANLYFRRTPGREGIMYRLDVKWDNGRRSSKLITPPKILWHPCNPVRWYTRSKYANGAYKFMRILDKWYKKNKKITICEIGAGNGGLTRLLISLGYKGESRTLPSTDAFTYLSASEKETLVRNLRVVEKEEPFKLHDAYICDTSVDSATSDENLKLYDELYKKILNLEILNGKKMCFFKMFKLTHPTTLEFLKHLITVCESVNLFKPGSSNPCNQEFYVEVRQTQTWVTKTVTEKVINQLSNHVNGFAESIDDRINATKKYLKEGKGGTICVIGHERLYDVLNRCYSGCSLVCGTNLPYVTRILRCYFGYVQAKYCNGRYEILARQFDGRMVFDLRHHKDILRYGSLYVMTLEAVNKVVWDVQDYEIKAKDDSRCYAQQAYGLVYDQVTSTDILADVACGDGWYGSHCKAKKVYLIDPIGPFGSWCNEDRISCMKRRVEEVDVMKDVTVVTMVNGTKFVSLEVLKEKFPNARLVFNASVIPTGIKGCKGIKVDDVTQTVSYNDQIEKVIDTSKYRRLVFNFTNWCGFLWKSARYFPTMKSVSYACLKFNGVFTNAYIDTDCKSTYTISMIGNLLKRKRVKDFKILPYLISAMNSSKRSAVPLVCKKSKVAEVLESTKDEKVKQASVRVAYDARQYKKFCSASAIIGIDHREKRVKKEKKKKKKKKKKIRIQSDEEDVEGEEEREKESDKCVASKTGTMIENRRIERRWKGKEREEEEKDKTKDQEKKMDKVVLNKSKGCMLNTSDLFKTRFNKEKVNSIEDTFKARFNRIRQSSGNPLTAEFLPSRTTVIKVVDEKKIEEREKEVRRKGYSGTCPSSEDRTIRRKRKKKIIRQNSTHRNTGYNFYSRRDNYRLKNNNNDLRGRYFGYHYDQYGGY